MTSDSHLRYNFGLVADVQTADKADGNTEGRTQRYRQAAACLDVAVQDWLEQSSELAFVLTLGDIIDGNATRESTEGDLERVAGAFDRLAGVLPVHHVVGNHCLSVERAALLQRLGICASYRKLPIAPGWRLIILDTTEMSGHSGFPADSPQVQEGRQYLESHPMSDVDPQMSSWNGGCGAEQVRWLRSELASAESASDRVIVAAHHQVGQGAARATHMAWNWRELQDMLLSSPAFAVFFCGHDHVGGYAEIDGRHFITLEAMLEAPEDGNAFAFVEVDGSALRIDGRGTAVTSRSLKLGLRDGPDLADFIRSAEPTAVSGFEPVAAAADAAREPTGNAPAQGRKRAFIQTMGCQMNVSDSEVVLAILRDAGYEQTEVMTDADVVLVNTCAIREGAEQRIWAWLGTARAAMLGPSAANSHQTRWQRRQAHARRPVLGVLGCMAERLKGQLLETDKLVDLVAGPDAYRDLPRLIAAVQGTEDSGRQTAMNVQLSLEETYADVVPLRPEGTTSAFLSIMRGCNNMCAFCIVPFTRGRERSRPVTSILEEVRMLSDSGVKEVTLLGQNVNSYFSYADNAAAPTDGARRPPPDAESVYAEGFSSVYRPNRAGAVPFAELLARVAGVDPEMRVRFTSPHPKEFSDDVLQVIAEHHNVCNQLHMPAQSGASSMLARMKRGYTRDAYDALVARVRQRIPGVALSTDIIAGFCGETEEEHAATVDLMRSTNYDSAFMFAYSQRDKTAAARHLEDDVPEAVKSARLQEIIATYRAGLPASMGAEVGRRHLVLVQGPSKRDAACLTGRTDTMKRVVFPDALMPTAYSDLQSGVGGDAAVRSQAGDYVAVEVVSASAGTLTAVPLGRTTLREFVSVHGTAAPLHRLTVSDSQQLLRAVG